MNAFLNYFKTGILLQPCPRLSNWNSWEVCSATCEGGIQIRTRFCLNGNFGNLGCDDRSQDLRVCNTQVRTVFYEPLRGTFDSYFFFTY